MVAIQTQPVATLTYSGFQPDFKSFSNSITFMVPGAIIQVGPRAGWQGLRMPASIFFQSTNTRPKIWH